MKRIRIQYCWILLAVLSCGGSEPSKAPASREAGRAGPWNPGRMLFVANVDGQWDLFSWIPFGTEPARRLTQTPGDERTPTASPKGGTAVYSDSGGDLWKIDLTSTESQRVTQPSEHDLFIQPDLGPDGRSLLIAKRKDRSRDDTNLVVIALDGKETDAEKIRFGPAWKSGPPAGTSFRTIPMVSSQFDPAWGPRGIRMAYAHLLSRWGGRVISEIWEGRVDESSCRQLTMLNALSIEPVWSPDGEEVVFCSDPEGQFDLYSVHVGTLEIRRLTTHAAADTEPTFSPDGRFIAFTSMRSGMSALWILDRRSEEVTQARPFGDGPRPMASPDWH